MIWRNGRVLIQKRRLEQMLGGLWEFPGGKREPNETIEETALREVREETGLRVRITGSYGSVKHAYSHFRITLHAFRCAVVSGRLAANSADACRWILPRQLAAFPFPRANQRIIETLFRGRHRFEHRPRDGAAGLGQARQKEIVEAPL